MAIKLIANYSKRLGLPGYSSHQFSVSVETELVATDDVSEESARIYRLLQTNVDEQILHTGFVPADGYGLESTNGNGYVNGNGSNGHAAHPSRNGNGHWSCSDKQKELILKLVDEHNLDRNTVEDLAHDRFGAGVKMLNKLQASGLITDLIDSAETENGKGQNGGKSRSNGHARKGGGR